MILKHWTKPLITKVFVAVAETVARLSSKSADLVRFEPVDLEVEIKRCEDQLENLKKTRDDKASAAKSWSAKVFEDALGYAKGDPLPNINVDGLVPEQELRPPTPSSSTPPSHMQEGAQGTQGTQGTRQKAFEGRPAPPPMHVSEEAPSELESAEQRILPDNTFLDESNPEASMEAEIKRQQRLAYQFAQNRQNDPRIRGLREAANTRNVVFNTDNVNYQNEAPHQQRWGQEVPDEVDSQQPQEIRRTPRLDPSKIVLNQDPSALPAPKNPRFTK
jgi:hypothetical protein